MHRSSALATVFALAITSVLATGCTHQENSTQASAAASESKLDIVDTAVSAGSFNTLVAALKAADLVDTLKGPGPFTVFAPTDEAFAALPPGAVDNLLKPENRDQLTQILTFHVVPDVVLARELEGTMLFAETVQGSPVKFNAMGKLTFGQANIIEADIETSNGVVHAIDTVLMPRR